MNQTFLQNSPPQAGEFFHKCYYAPLLLNLSAPSSLCIQARFFYPGDNNQALLVLAQEDGAWQVLVRQISTRNSNKVLLPDCAQNYRHHFDLVCLTPRTTCKLKVCALLPLYSTNIKFPSMFWSCQSPVDLRDLSCPELSSLWFPIYKINLCCGF